MVFDAGLLAGLVCGWNISFDVVAANVHAYGETASVVVNLHDSSSDLVYGESFETRRSYS